MADGDARFRHQLRQALRRFLDVFDVVVEVVNRPPRSTRRIASRTTRLSYSRTKVFTANRRAGRWR
ncbi:hypothetical protein M8494_14055 [Serratia ureilytica]